MEIGLIGKYVELKDSYKSISEALIHAGAENRSKVEVRWIHSEDLTPAKAKAALEGLHGSACCPRVWRTRL